jgi:hypothetical protein
MAKHLFFVRTTMGMAILLACLVCIAPAVAQQKGDLLAETRQKLDLEAQKLEAEVTSALDDAEKLANSDPIKAAAMLRRILVIVDGDLSMSAKKRDALLKTLRDKIQKYENNVDRKSIEPLSKSRSDEISKEKDQAQRDVDALRAMQRAGKGDEARQKMEELAKKYPTNPAIIAQQRIASTRENLDASKDVQRQRSQGFSQMSMEIERSLRLPVNDVEFAKDWKDKVKNRTSQPQMSKKEKEILEALRTPIDIDFEDQPLDEVIDYISKKLKVSIMLDKTTLDSVGQDYKAKITVKAKEVTLRTVLHKVLGEVGLTYIIRNETIDVVTPEVANKTLITRNYSIADLVGFTNQPLGGFLQGIQLATNVQNLMSLIVSTIEPQTWEINGQGGQGTIVFYAPTMSLVIRQTAELHMALGGAFK